MAKSCLVLGGTAFIGKHLVTKLLGRGYDVTVLNRGKKTSSPPDNVTQIICDRTDYDALAKALGSTKWDYVFDVISYKGVHTEQIIELLDGSIVQVYMDYGVVVGGARHLQR